jgi:hypothetical protein
LIMFEIHTIWVPFDIPLKTIKFKLLKLSYNFDVSKCVGLEG